MTSPSSRRDPVLAVLGPAEHEGVITEGLTACGLSVRFRAPKPGASDSPAQDPYGVERFAIEMRDEADGVLVIGSRRVIPLASVPAPVSSGLPVGLVVSNQPEDLRPWLHAVQTREGRAPIWAVLAMWRDSYLSLGRWLVTRLRRGTPEAVQPWFADTVDRVELCRRLATGPRLVIYVGHGRARGLSGYLGVRWHHIAEESQFVPSGTFMCFACDTLKREREAMPFGCRWVAEGRGAAFVGAAAPIPLKAHTLLAREAGKVLQDGGHETVGELLTALDERVSSVPSLREARQAFATFRLIGNPLERLQ